MVFYFPSVAFVVANLGALTLPLGHEKKKTSDLVVPFKT